MIHNREKKNRMFYQCNLIFLQKEDEIENIYEIDHKWAIKVINEITKIYNGTKIGRFKMIILRNNFFYWSFEFAEKYKVYLSLSLALSLFVPEIYYFHILFVFSCIRIKMCSFIGEAERVCGLVTKDRTREEE